MAQPKLPDLVLTNENKIIFKHLKPEDAEAFLKFRGQIPHDSTHTLNFVGMTLPSLEDSAKQLAMQKQTKNTLNIAAFENNKLIGYLNFRMPYQDHPWFTHVAQFGMMILKENWGQGIGRRLLEIQDTHARACGISRIEAMVRIGNPRGVDLYTKSGFIIEGTKKNAAWINGEFQDEYYIAKLLDLS